MDFWHPEGIIVLASPWLELVECLRYGLRPAPPPGGYDAAINIVLTFCPDPRLVMVEKARRPDDPWGGDMAFPGGRRVGGESPLDTAVRETLEEACLGPGDYEVLGFLDTASPRNVPGLRVVPVVSVAYGCVAERVCRSSSSEEVARVALVPLPCGLRVERVLHPARGRVVEAYRSWYGDIVWGMSFRVLRSLLGVLCGCRLWRPCTRCCGGDEASDGLK